jgi:hypothetical protein
MANLPQTWVFNPTLQHCHNIHLQVLGDKIAILVRKSFVLLTMILTLKGSIIIRSRCVVKPYFSDETDTGSFVINVEFADSFDGGKFHLTRV